MLARIPQMRPDASGHPGTFYSTYWHSLSLSQPSFTRVSLHLLRGENEVRRLSARDNPSSLNLTDVFIHSSLAQSVNQVARFTSRRGISLPPPDKLFLLLFFCDGFPAAAIRQLRKLRQLRLPEHLELQPRLLSPQLEGADSDCDTTRPRQMFSAQDDSRLNKLKHKHEK